MIENVAIFTADRAERGLIEPVYKELMGAGINVGFMMTTPGNPFTAAQEVEKFCEKVLFDFAIVPCVPSGTLIPTSMGFRDIADMRPGERVLSHDGYFHLADHVSKRPFKGTLVQLKSRLYPSARFTPEHPVYCAKMGGNPVGWHRYRRKLNRGMNMAWIPANDVRIGDLIGHPVMKVYDSVVNFRNSIYLPAIYGSHHNLKSVQSLITIDKPLLKLLGLYAAEGSAERRRVRFTFGDDEEELCEFVLSQFEESFGIAGKLQSAPRHSLSVQFNSAGLARVFAEWFGTGAAHKQVPQWIFALLPEKTVAFTDGVILGDGWQIHRGFSHSTISERLHLGLLQLFNKQGLLPSSWRGPPSKNSYGKHEVFQLTWKRPRAGKINARQTGFFYKDCVWTSVARKEYTPYAGHVYNLTVEKTNSYVTGTMASHNCDRPEMVGVALWLFYHNKPFAQFHAGDVGSGTHDEVGRWIISRCASLHFCNSPESAYNLIKNGEEEWRVHLVGSTAFDGILPDMSVGPDFPFDLLLVHPDTFSAENTLVDINKALGLLDKFTVIVGPNEDANHEIIVQQLLNYHYRDGAQGYEYYSSLPREKFLGVMAKCQRFITNSSSALYELPQFGIHKWVNIGLRNADRKPLTEIDPGASKKIAGIIKNLQIDDKLLRKKFAP